MTKSVKIIIAICMIIFGWVLNAYAWTSAPGPTINTLCLILGLGLMGGGLTLILIILTKN